MYEKPLLHLFARALLYSYTGDENFFKKSIISASLHTVIRGPSFIGFG